ncbi:hypothetical protein MMC13_001227 [Lambiella insularis]|nr:hypothetical protein [Lambiella insularis]
MAGNDEVLSCRLDQATHAGRVEGPTNTKNRIKKVDVDDTSSEDSLDLTSGAGRHNKNFMSRSFLEKRLEKANKRVLQHQSYIQLVEDRLASLELAMSRIGEQQEYRKGNSDNVFRPARPDTSHRFPKDGSNTSIQVALVAQIVRIPMAEFRPPLPKGIDGRDSSDSRINLTAEPLHSPPHVIKVAITAPSEPSSRRRPRSRYPSVPLAGVHEDRTEPAGDPDLLACVPERVRIRSTILLKTLEKITEGKFAVPRSAGKHHTRDTRRPTYADEKGIPTLLEHQPMIEEKSTPPDEDITISREASDHLRLLVELFDVDLKGLFQLRHQIKNGALSTIAFADLWHLFSHGEEVCSSSDHAQMYRVFHFTGGRRYLSDKQRDHKRVIRQPRERSRYAERTRAREREQDYYDNDNDNGVQHLTPSRRTNDFLVQCFSFDFDGVDYGPTQKTFGISWYEGEVPINSLNIFPQRFQHMKSGNHSQASLLLLTKKKLIERGKRFVKLSKVAHQQYKGLTIDNGDEIDSQVIIDFALGLLQNRDLWNITFGLRKPIEADTRETKEESAWADIRYPRKDSCSTPGCCDNDYIHVDDEMDLGHVRDMISEQENILNRFSNPDVLTDEDYMLFPIRVIGFVLRDRTWAMLDIDKIIDVQPSKAGLDALWLPKSHKRSLLALVMSHPGAITSSSATRPDDQTQFDLIAGKGKGLVVLLHGAPGVGKSSTVESIASHTHRPLFPITCGDLGETANEVDSKLKSTFQLAHKWGCILLLDEADVYLQRRNKTDMQRNSIVSVFLRNLEYNSGIVFLTTNRIGTIDPAFKSRIHMSLYYPALDEEATREIWKWHIMNVAKSRKDMVVEKKEIFKFALTHFAELQREKAVWNGRQIRNAFQTAVALAEYDVFKMNEEYKVDAQPRLKAEHFEQVARASMDFDKYLQAVLGGHSDSDSDLARRAQERLEDSHDGQALRGESTQRGGRAGIASVPKIPRSPALPVRRADDFRGDDWDDPDNKLSGSVEDDEDWTEDRSPAARSRPAEESRPESAAKRASRNGRN